MARARLVAVTVIGLSLAAAPPGRGGLPAPTAVRSVATGGVVAHVPPTWEVRPLPSPVSRVVGLQASANLARWSNGGPERLGVEAYWVDATGLGVPSGYYRAIASGPALNGLPHDDGCQAEDVWTSTGRATGSYVATATGTCHSVRGATRWGAVVAAPGFGPVRQMGIARSGLYFVLGAVPGGREAEHRLNRLLTTVSFGGTPVSDILASVGAPARVA